MLESGEAGGPEGAVEGGLGVPWTAFLSQKRSQVPMLPIEFNTICYHSQLKMLLRNTPQICIEISVIAANAL